MKSTYLEETEVDFGYNNLKMKKRFIQSRTLVLSILAVVTSISLFFIGRDYYYQSYSGYAETILIPNSSEIHSIEDLTNLKDLKGNVLYIDYWGTHCPPCMREFQHLVEQKDLKERYKGKAVRFVYLASCDSNETARWKRIINKYELHGYHMQMIGYYAY